MSDPLLLPWHARKIGQTPGRLMGSCRQVEPLHPRAFRRLGRSHRETKMATLQCPRHASSHRIPAASAPQEPLIPATAFGISVGIKDKGRFRALIEAGQTPATRLRHPKTGIESIYMTEADIAAFHRRFVTIPTLVAETGRPIPELRAELKRAGVAVFAPDGQDFGRLFLRATAEAALRRERTRKP